jgi:hypothetical protein
MVGRLGLVALERWACLARGQADAVRLHDIVYACANGLRAELPIDLDAFRDRLQTYLRGAIDPKGIEFVRVARRHRALLARLLTEQPGPGILCYAYFHGNAPRDLDPALIGDPAADAANGPVGPVREWVLSIVQAIESSYRYTRDRGQKDKAKQDLKDRLALFDLLKAAPDIDADSKITIRHHHAKSLLKLGEGDDAEREFEAIVAAGKGNYPSRLQLARLLKKNPARAKALIFEIIEAEELVPGTVQMTTLIETLATLRRSHLRGFTAEMTKRFGPFMAQMIKAATWSGEAQPVRAFAAVGPYWSYLEPGLFREVYEEIDLGSPASAEDDDERVAVGRICIAARKMYLRQNMVPDADAALARALQFFGGLEVIRPFGAVHFADALLQAGNPLKVAEILDNVPVEKRDAFWHLRRAEAIMGTGGANGVDCIDRGIALLKAPEYRATFLAVKGELLHRAADPGDVIVLNEAIASCTNDQYRAELQLRLDDWKAATASTRRRSSTARTAGDAGAVR